MSDLSDSKQKPIFTATQNDAGQRVDNYLLKQCKQLNKASCYKLIRKGQIRINGKRIKPMQKLIANDQVRVPPFVYFVEQKAVEIPKSIQQQLFETILFEDSDYLVVNKPAGLPCHKGSGHPYGLVEVFKSMDGYSDIQLAHRLDKYTSGCLLLAKNRPALVIFQACLKQHQVKKSYLAVLTGQLEDSITVDQPLDTDNRVNGIRKVVVSTTGKKAKTDFKPIKFNHGVTLTQCDISTGRTHQIRAHAAYIGFPIYGDELYGNRSIGSSSMIYLHAQKLRFGEYHFNAIEPSTFNDLLL